MNGAKFQDILHILKTQRITTLLKKAIKDAIDNFPDEKEKFFPLLFRNNPHIKYIIHQLKDYISRIEFLDVHVYQLDELRNEVDILSIFVYNRNKRIFEHNVNHILKIMDNIYKDHVKDQIKKLTCEECFRLDEAVTNFKNCCLFSAVILAISAIEARLHYLIQGKNKTIYKEYFEKAPLGTLISLFDKDKFTASKFKSCKNILPEEYAPLMKVLKTYRIYSVHPKGKRISYNIVQSILNFTFTFLLDDRLKIKDKKVLRHKH